MRDELLAELSDRVIRFVDEGQADVVLWDDARHLAERLLEAVPDPASDLEVLQVLGWLYGCSYLAWPDGQGRTHLAVALQFFEPVYRSTPDDVPDGIRKFFDTTSSATSPATLAGWGADVLNQAVPTGDRVTLEAAIGLLERALDATPCDQPGRSEIMSRLCAALTSRFERTGRLEDLDRAVEVGEQAVDATPLGHSDLPVIMSLLGSALRRRFERTGVLEDLDRAIDVIQEAMNATPLAHLDRTFC